jgi:hypothetical protein
MGIGMAIAAIGVLGIVFRKSLLRSVLRDMARNFGDSFAESRRAPGWAIPLAAAGTVVIGTFLFVFGLGHLLG